MTNNGEVSLLSRPITARWARLAGGLVCGLPENSIPDAVLVRFGSGGEEVHGLACEKVVMLGRCTARESHTKAARTVHWRCGGHYTQRRLRTEDITAAVCGLRIASVLWGYRREGR